MKSRPSGQVAELDAEAVIAESLGAAWATGNPAFISDALAVREYAARQREPRDWRPIETAPKDGTLIDLWGVRGSSGYRFADCEWGKVYGGGMAWLYDGMAVEMEKHDPYRFTHWMPLPAPPSS